LQVVYDISTLVLIGFHILVSTGSITLSIF